MKIGRVINGKNCFSMVIIILLSFLTTVFSEEEIGSPLKIAQCRAYCIHRFASDTSSQKTCFQDSDCFMCWEDCQLLQANFPVWGGICSETEICYPGCQQACKFHREISPIQQSVPVIQTRGEEVIFVKNHTAYWPTPSSKTRQQEGRGYPLVYVVMRRLPGKMWKQITQTLELSSRIPDDLSSGAMLRVLVVDREALLTIYSPVASESTLRSANDIAKSFGQASVSSLFQNSPSSNDNSSVTDASQLATIDSVSDFQMNSGNPISLQRTSWNLREISLIHQKVLVIAEVAWDAIPQLLMSRSNYSGNNTNAISIREQQQKQRSVYYVTWEVDGGGLKGNLFTDSTCVTLTLWPDTVYHIQVELVDHTIDTGRAQQSEDFLLDTHRAIAVEMDTSSSPVQDEQTQEDDTILDEDDEDEMIESTNSFNDSNNDNVIDNDGPAYSVTLKTNRKTNQIQSISRKIDAITTDYYKDQYEVIIAIAAAFVVFLILLIVLVYASCRHSDILAYPPFNKDIFSFKPDGKKLPDYTHFPKEFMPILTMVTENVSNRSSNSQKNQLIAAGQTSSSRSSTPPSSRSLSKRSSSTLSSSSSSLDTRRYNNDVINSNCNNDNINYYSNFVPSNNRNCNNNNTNTNNNNNNNNNNSNGNYFKFERPSLIMFDNLRSSVDNDDVRKNKSDDSNNQDGRKIVGDGPIDVVTSV